MWIVVHMDMYSGDGASCDDPFSGHLQEVFGPFYNKADAESFCELKEGEQLYAQEFSVRPLKEPNI